MQSCEIRISIGKRREQIRRAKFLNLNSKGKIAMADRLIDIGLILFFGGFGFVCYINGVCGIGKDYMQRNKIDFVRWMFSPKHILRSNTPFNSNEPLELKFKEPKSKHLIYNFFELIIHYAIIAPFLVIYAWIFLFCAGLAIKILSQI